MYLRMYLHGVEGGDDIVTLGPTPCITTLRGAVSLVQLTQFHNQPKESCNVLPMQGLWLRKLYLAWFLEPESLNGQYTDPLGKSRVQAAEACRPSRGRCRRWSRGRKPGTCAALVDFEASRNPKQPQGHLQPQNCHLFAWVTYKFDLGLYDKNRQK